MLHHTRFPQLCCIFPSLIYSRTHSSCCVILKLGILWCIGGGGCGRNSQQTSIKYGSCPLRANRTFLFGESCSSHYNTLFQTLVLQILFEAHFPLPSPPHSLSLFSLFLLPFFFKRSFIFMLFYLYVCFALHVCICVLEKVRKRCRILES